MRTSRRTFLAGSAALPVTAAMAKLPVDLQATVAADLDKYIGFGSKQAGGAGDMACGNWLAAELERLEFEIERQEFATPFFEPMRSELVCGESKASLWPQPIVVQTGPDGVTGPLVRVDPTGRAEASLDGAIALVDLPFGRWSSALAKPIREPIAAAFAAGAKAVVAITNGPTGKVIALNADGRAPMFGGPEDHAPEGAADPAHPCAPGQPLPIHGPAASGHAARQVRAGCLERGEPGGKPVALLAPENAKPFLAGATRRASATMFVRGNGGRRPAFNFVGRIDRGKARWLVVSTPRSGWFGCAGERGPGIAAWLWLARWASRSVQGYNLAFVCNTGHEYEYLGASEALKSFTPKPADTHFWLHLGANVAARDWHEGLGQWRALPSVDTQRYLAVSPSLLPVANEVFAGHAGLEAPYSSADLSAGELVEIMAAGYAPAAGVFGIHRFHHVAEDDARCVSAASVAATAAAFQRFVEKLI